MEAAAGNYVRAFCVVICATAQQLSENVSSAVQFSSVAGASSDRGDVFRYRHAWVRAGCARDDLAGFRSLSLVVPRCHTSEAPEESLASPRPSPFRCSGLCRD